MFRINSTYEKGEIILIFYIPLVAVIMVLTHVVPEKQIKTPDWFLCIMCVWMSPPAV